MERYALSKNFQGYTIGIQLNFTNDKSLTLRFLEGNENHMLRTALKVEQGAEINLDTDENPAYNFRFHTYPGLDQELPVSIHVKKGFLSDLLQEKDVENIKKILQDVFSVTLWNESVVEKIKQQEEPEEDFHLDPVKNEFEFNESWHGVQELLKETKQDYAKIQQQIADTLAENVRERSDIKQIQVIYFIGGFGAFALKEAFGVVGEQMVERMMGEVFTKEDCLASFREMPELSHLKVSVDDNFVQNFVHYRGMFKMMETLKTHNGVENQSADNNDPREWDGKADYSRNWLTFTVKNMDELKIMME